MTQVLWEVEFIWIEYEPGAITHIEPMSHPGEENALCLEGSVVVTIDGQEFVLTRGDSISFDSGRLHQVENRSKKKAVLVSAITPPAFDEGAGIQPVTETAGTFC